MNFKRTLILLTFWSLWSICFGQKCEVKSDPITGEKIVQFINKYNTLRFEYKGGDSIDFYSTFSYQGEQNVIIPAGSDIFLKLNNGKIIALKSIRDAVPQTNVLSSSVYTNYTFTFKLTKEQINILASDEIVFMRYPSTDGGHIDYDVKGLGKIYPAKITNGAQCISGNL